MSRVLSCPADDECSRGCQDEICPLTQENISDLEHVVRIYFQNKIRCYDLESLVGWLQLHPNDPMTRVEYPQPILDGILDQYRRTFPDRPLPTLMAGEHKYMDHYDRMFAMGVIDQEELDEIRALEGRANEDVPNQPLVNYAVSIMNLASSADLFARYRLTSDSHWQRLVKEVLSFERMYHQLRPVRPDGVSDLINRYIVVRPISSQKPILEHVAELTGRTVKEVYALYEMLESTVAIRSMVKDVLQLEHERGMRNEDRPRRATEWLAQHDPLHRVELPAPRRRSRSVERRRSRSIERHPVVAPRPVVAAPVRPPNRYNVVINAGYRRR